MAWAADMKDDSRYLPGAKSNHLEVLLEAVKIAEKPVLTECPFAERELRDNLLASGCEVIPIFVVEPADLVACRYEARERKPLPKNVYTRASSIANRAAEWSAFRGTSEEVLAHLRGLAHE